MFLKQYLALALLPFLAAAVPAFSSSPECAANPPEQRLPAEPIATLPLEGIPATWLQGTPITQWEKDKVYILEFWATWCGPCVASIPHLETIHQEITAKKINAQLVGINIKDKTPPEKLKQFLAERRVVPSYAIAADTEKNTDELWVRPRKMVGIPHAIAVKNGKVLWSGHPVKLNADFIAQMVAPDFPEEARMRELEKTGQNSSRMRVEKIAALYAAGENALAEEALNQLLEDKKFPVSMKQKALELPCLNALVREDFRKMNACLRRKAEAFPQDVNNLHRVARFILNNNDIPAEEQDLALAEECLNRALPLSPQKPQLHQEQLHMLAKIHALRGDREAEIKAREDCFRASAEYIWLNQLEQSLNQNPAAEKALAAYTALSRNQKELPEEFLIKAKPESETANNEIPLFRFEKSSSPESASVLEFLNSLNWIRGEAPKQLPADGIVILNFWAPPLPGPTDSLSHRPAKWLDEKIRGHEKNIPVYIVAVESQRGRTEKVLTFPHYETTLPVAVMSKQAFSEKFGTKFAFHLLPQVMVLRDGKIIWKGSTQDLPDWIAKEASNPDYNEKEAQAGRDTEKANYREKLRILRGIRLSDAAKNPDLEKRLEAFRKCLKDQPALYMRASKMLAEIACIREDFAKAGKICEAIIKEYPHVEYIAQMQLNILNSDVKLRAANLPVILLAYRNILESGNAYASAYWQAISQVYAEMGEWEKAVYAAFAARNASDEWKTLCAVRASE